MHVAGPQPADVGRLPRAHTPVAVAALTLVAPGVRLPRQVLHRALLGFMLIHRAHRQPADLLQPPQGSCHPCHLAAFHVAYEAMCTHARHSHTGSTDGTSSSSGSVELPPIAVLYDALAHLPPECLVLASWARPAFEPPGPFDAGRVPPFSPQHLGLLVQVGTKCDGWNGLRAMALLNRTSEQQRKCSEKLQGEWIIAPLDTSSQMPSSCNDPDRQASCSCAGFSSLRSSQPGFPYSKLHVPRTPGVAGPTAAGHVRQRAPQSLAF